MVANRATTTSSATAPVAVILVIGRRSKKYTASCIRAAETIPNSVLTWSAPPRKPSFSPRAAVSLPADRTLPNVETDAAFLFIGTDDVPGSGHQCGHLSHHLVAHTHRSVAVVSTSFRSDTNVPSVSSESTPLTSPTARAFAADEACAVRAARRSSSTAAMEQATAVAVEIR